MKNDCGAVDGVDDDDDDEGDGITVTIAELADLFADAGLENEKEATPKSAIDLSASSRIFASVLWSSQI